MTESSNTCAHSEVEDQHVDPWSVKASASGFNYLKLLNHFGTKPITPELIKRIESLTRMPVHRLLRRGIFFSQQSLVEFLDHYEKGKPVFLYTGRGPSSESMHLGHMVPFEVTKYLQDAFGCILVVQMSDDEKFYFKGGNSLDYFTRLARENAKDIISVGFDPSRTYIFSNRNELKRQNGGLIDNLINMMDYTPVNVVRSAFGLNSQTIVCDEVSGEQKVSATPCSVGQMAWPVFQSIPAFSSSFNFIFGDQEALCLVPMAVDQAPYFRLCRDFADFARLLKPAEVHSEFLVGLSGIASKMSTTEGVKPIFLTDTEEEVKVKIQRCFTGGCETRKEQLEKGSNLLVDVPYQWLLVFLESDEELERIARDYGPPTNGNVRMMTSEIKKIMFDVVMNYLKQHQAKRELVTDEVLDHFFSPNREFDLSRPPRKDYQLKSDEEYAKQGSNFDRYFGLYSSSTA